MKYKNLFFWALILYWGALLTATHIPHPPQPVTVSDKTEHMVAYGVLAFLLTLNFHVRNLKADQIIGRVVVIIMVGGAVDEWTQPLVGRSCDYYDWVADLVGGTLATTATALVASVFK